MELSRALRRRAKKALELPARTRAHTGAVSVVQRGDSALRLNVHFHVLALDGVYIRDADGKLAFHALPPPTTDDVTEVAVRTAKRLQKVLARHGRLLEDGTVDPSPRAEQLALSALVGAAASGLGLAGERSGKPLLRVVDPEKARALERVGESLGVNVHAEVAVPARDRARLERLCRYVCRPPIAQERLVEVAGGKLRYLLKKPWSDGTVALVLEPLDLCARIAALITPPRFHMIRYDGALSSHAKLRSEVVLPHASSRSSRARRSRHRHAVGPQGVGGALVVRAPGEAAWPRVPEAGADRAVHRGLRGAQRAAGGGGGRRVPRAARAGRRAAGPGHGAARVAGGAAAGEAFIMRLLLRGHTPQ